MTLDEYLTQTRITTADFAAALGVKPETVRRYRGGERIPEPEYMAKIVTQTCGAVTANDFYGVPAARPIPTPPAEQFNPEAAE